MGLGRGVAACAQAYGNLNHCSAPLGAMQNQLLGGAAHLHKLDVPVPGVLLCGRVRLPALRRRRQGIRQ